MDSEEILIYKKIILINQLTGHKNQIKMNLVYVPQKRQINFKKALQQIHSHSINLLNTQIFYTDFNKKMNIYIGQMPFQHQIMIKSQLFFNDIQIIYKNIKDNITNSIQKQIKRRKVKQRSIKQAIEAVKKWRQLYQQSDNKGKRIFTLQSAAQKVGYAKKTLDDYFNQLRLAQTFNFDFNKHYSDKIGVLRNFVKKNSHYQQINKYSNQIQAQSPYPNYKQQEIDQYLRHSSSSDSQSNN